MSTLEQLPPDFLKTFVRHIKLLRIIGVDIFPETNISFVRKYTRCCIFNMLFIPMTVGQVMYIMLGGDIGASFLDVANAIPTTFMALQDAVKMIVVFYKRKEIKGVIMGVAEIWPIQIESDVKKKTYKTWLRRLKTMDDTFFKCSIVSVLIYETMPLAATVEAMYSDPQNFEYQYPLQSYFMHGLKSHWQYAMGYLYLFITSTTTHVVLYIASDFLLVTLTFNLSTLMDLLQKDLENVVENCNDSLEENIQNIKVVITRHQKLLRLADELSNIFGLLTFVQMTFSSIVICCFGFLTVIAEGVPLNNLAAAIQVAVSIWTLCWPGQLLIDTSFGISEAAYRSKWYTKDKALRKYISIVMIRAQKPSHLTALGFSNLMLANFSKILSTSWSYLSLLNQMYQDSAKS